MLASSGVREPLVSKARGPHRVTATFPRIPDGNLAEFKMAAASGLEISQDRTRDTAVRLVLERSRDDVHRASRNTRTQLRSSLTSLTLVCCSTRSWSLAGAAGSRCSATQRLSFARPTVGLDLSFFTSHFQGE